MMDIVIVDDEQKSIDLLAIKINRVCADCQIKSTFTDPDEALTYLRETQIDLLFLDIDMPGMSGFELLECLDEYNFAVIFVTAYDEYALKALRMSALDYLLKPVDIKELKEAFDKFDKLVRKGFKLRLENVRSNLNNLNQAKRISLVSKESIDLVELRSIIFCNSQSNYTAIKLDNGKSILMSKTLKDFELMLDEHDFIRVHHSYLVNINHISAFVKKDGGYLLMSEDSQVPVSRSRKDEVLRMIG